MSQYTASTTNMTIAVPTFIIIWCGIPALLSASELSCDPGPQNGTSTNIICTACQGTKDDFVFPTSSDEAVIAIAGVNESDMKIDGVPCGKINVGIIKKSKGKATVTIKLKNQNEEKKVDFELTAELFSMRIPDFLDFGELREVSLPPGQRYTVVVKLIDTVTEEDRSTSGTGWASVVGNGEIKFAGGGTSTEIDFLQGMTSFEIDVASTAPPGIETSLIISDSDSIESVAGSDIVHTAFINLSTPLEIPLLNRFGLGVIVFLIAILGLLLLRRTF